MEEVVAACRAVEGGYIHGNVVDVEGDQILARNLEIETAAELLGDGVIGRKGRYIKQIRNAIEIRWTAGAVTTQAGLLGTDVRGIRRATSKSDQRPANVEPLALDEVAVHSLRQACVRAGVMVARTFQDLGEDRACAFHGGELRRDCAGWRRTIEGGSVIPAPTSGC